MSLANKDFLTLIRNAKRENKKFLKKSSKDRLRKS